MSHIQIESIRYSILNFLFTLQENIIISYMNINHVFNLIPGFYIFNSYYHWDQYIVDSQDNLRIFLHFYDAILRIEKAVDKNLWYVKSDSF